MGNEQAVPETKGIAVELLAALDLGPELEGMAGCQLRMRMVTIEPGGVFGPIHDHKGRPGMVYVLQGTITDHRKRLCGGPADSRRSRNPERLDRCTNWKTRTCQKKLSHRHCPRSVARDTLRP